MSEKEIVFITGANRGLGYETVKALFQSPKPYHVFLGSRSPANGEVALARLAAEVPQTSSTAQVVQVDVRDDHSIRRAAELITSETGKIDILINNAGNVSEEFVALDAPSFRSIFTETFDTHVIGAQVVTAAMAPLLLASSSPRLLFSTSGTGSLEVTFHHPLYRGMPPVPPGWPKEGVKLFPAYRAAKAALNMVMLSWRGLLEPDGVKVWGVSPGLLDTELGDMSEWLRSLGATHPSTGGELMRSVIEGERDADVGKVVRPRGDLQPW